MSVGVGVGVLVCLLVWVSVCVRIMDTHFFHCRRD